MPPRPPHDRHVPSSAIAGFIDRARIEQLLTPWLPDAESRAFVVRLILGEGPAHHRGANFVLLALLGRVLEALPAPPAQPTSPSSSSEHLDVPLRLPPHLAREAGPRHYPLRLPTAPLQTLSGGDARAFEAMVDCVTDGPAHHALANVAMVTLLSEVLARLPGGGSK